MTDPWLCTLDFGAEGKTPANVVPALSGQYFARLPRASDSTRVRAYEETIPRAETIVICGLAAIHRGAAAWKPPE